MTSSRSRKLAASIERWPIAGSFTISRGAKTEAVTVVATVSHGDHTGRGECVPYPRYGETPEATLAVLEAMQEAVSGGLDRQALQAAMPAGAARNALDCALLDLEAKSCGQRVWTMLGRPAPRPRTTAFTISLGTPEAMATATARLRVLRGRSTWMPVAPGCHRRAGRARSTRVTRWGACRSLAAPPARPPVQPPPVARPCRSLHQ